MPRRSLFARIDAPKAVTRPSTLFLLLSESNAARLQTRIWLDRSNAGFDSGEPHTVTTYGDPSRRGEHH